MRSISLGQRAYGLLTVVPVYLCVRRSRIQTLGLVGAARVHVGVGEVVARLQGVGVVGAQDPLAIGHAAVIKPPPLPRAIPGGFTIDDFTVDDQDFGPRWG